MKLFGFVQIIVERQGPEKGIFFFCSVFEYSLIIGLLISRAFLFCVRGKCFKARSYGGGECTSALWRLRGRERIEERREGTEDWIYRSPVSHLSG